MGFNGEKNYEDKKHRSPDRRINDTGGVRGEKASALPQRPTQTGWKRSRSKGYR
jgi:hypothetical protein